MAFFGVTIETIDTVKHVPKADKLDVCTLEGLGFEFVTGRDEWKPGDKCLYFPLDSVLPDELAEKLGVLGRLSGSKKNRIKTVKLRGQISQGLIGPLSLVFKEPYAGTEDTDPERLTELLGVTKYEPPEKFVQGIKGTKVKIITLPAGQSVYDIEGADRYPQAVTQLALGNVVITEKLEGSNWSATATPDRDKGWDVSVNTRKHAIILNPEDEESDHPFWKAYWEQDLVSLMERLIRWYGYERQQIVLYGEFCGPGVQKNIYDLSDPKVFLFDIKVGKLYLSPQEFFQAALGYQTVPTIAYDVDLIEWLAEQYPQDWDYETNGEWGVKGASTGKSIIRSDILREGIVIRPMVEQWCNKLQGRLIIKQRSPEYLAGSKI